MINAFLAAACARPENLKMEHDIWTLAVVIRLFNVTFIFKLNNIDS